MTLEEIIKEKEKYRFEIHEEMISIWDKNNLEGKSVWYGNFREFLEYLGIDYVNW